MSCSSFAFWQMRRMNDQSSRGYFHMQATVVWLVWLQFRNYLISTQAFSSLNEQPTSETREDYSDLNLHFSSKKGFQRGSNVSKHRLRTDKGGLDCRQNWYYPRLPCDSLLRRTKSKSSQGWFSRDRWRCQVYGRWPRLTVKWQQDVLYVLGGFWISEQGSTPEGRMEGHFWCA